MNNLRLRPDYPVPIIRDTAAMVIVNKKGVKVYRASGKRPKSKLSPSYKSIIRRDKIVPYKIKSNRLKVYQLFHDTASLHNCSNSQHVTRLSLNPSFRSKDDTIEVLGDIKYKTNQISESRAFLHATLGKIKHKYIGFTSHRHDRKFFRIDRAVPIADINFDLVEKAFTGYHNVKFIAFRIHPASDFISNVSIRGIKGTQNFLYDFFKCCYRLDRPSYDNLLESMKGKMFPYCNSFITTAKETKNYASFMMDFLDWADDKYGLDKTLVPVGKMSRSYDSKRGWGYICEQLIWYYIAFKYQRDFTIAFIDENHHITYHDRMGYGVEG